MHRLWILNVDVVRRMTAQSSEAGGFYTVQLHRWTRLQFRSLSFQLNCILTFETRALVVFKYSNTVGLFHLGTAELMR